MRDDIFGARRTVRPQFRMLCGCWRRVGYLKKGEDRVSAA